MNHILEKEGILDPARFEIARRLGATGALISVEGWAMNGYGHIPEVGIQLYTMARRCYRCGNMDVDIGRPPIDDRKKCLLCSYGASEVYTFISAVGSSIDDAICKLRGRLDDARDARRTETGWRWEAQHD